MIARLMNEGQYRIDESVHERLNEIDERAVKALQDGNEEELLQRMWDLVQAEGERVPDDELAPSELVIPPPDLTLEETRKLFSDDGLIPDLPIPS
jgi:hypothetical protein